MKSAKMTLFFMVLGLLLGSQALAGKGPGSSASNQGGQGNTHKIMEQTQQQQQVKKMEQKQQGELTGEQLLEQEKLMKQNKEMRQDREQIHKAD